MTTHLKPTPENIAAIAAQVRQASIDAGVLPKHLDQVDAMMAKHNNMMEKYEAVEALTPTPGHSSMSGYEQDALVQAHIELGKADHIHVGEMEALAADVRAHLSARNGGLGTQGDLMRKEFDNEAYLFNFFYEASNKQMIEEHRRARERLANMRRILHDLEAAFPAQDFSKERKAFEVMGHQVKDMQSHIRRMLLG